MGISICLLTCGWFYFVQCSVGHCAQAALAWRCQPLLKEVLSARLIILEIQRKFPVLGSGCSFLVLVLVS